MRNANGTGSISKLKGNRRKPFVLYSPSFFDSNINKYRKLPIAYFSSREEAEIYRIAYFSNNTDMLKLNNKNNKITFEEVYSIWIKYKNLKNSSLKNIHSYFNNSLKLHKLPIANINGILLQDIFHSLNLSNGTLRNLKSFWSNLWDFAVLNDFANKNYPKYLKLPMKEKGKRTSKRERVFSSEELVILWSNLYKDKRNIVDIVLILCYTGLRISELLNIKIKDINLKHTYIDIVDSKTSSGIRKVVISDKILPLIKKRIDFRNTYLFSKINGSQYKYDAFDNHFRLLCKELALNYHTIHDTRHTFASMLSNIQADKDTIIKMIGHSSYKTTSKIYIHKTLSDMKNVVDMI